MDALLKVCALERFVVDAIVNRSNLALDRGEAIIKLLDSLVEVRLRHHVILDEMMISRMSFVSLSIRRKHSTEDIPAATRPTSGNDAEIRIYKFQTGDGFAKFERGRLARLSRGLRVCAQFGLEAPSRERFSSNVNGTTVCVSHVSGMTGARHVIEGNIEYG